MIYELTVSFNGINKSKRTKYDNYQLGYSNKKHKCICFINAMKLFGEFRVNKTRFL